jgi:ATP-dependent protease ClpP protease subunit
MTLKTLPAIQTLNRPSKVSSLVEDEVFDRWDTAVMAKEEEATVNILDAIGADWYGDGWTARKLSAILRNIGDRDIQVNINSPGGDFFEGVAMYSLLRDHKAKVTVRVLGLAASAASVIAMAADDLQISEAGFIMIHNAWAVAVGNRHDFREAADLLEPFDEAMVGLYAARTGKPKTTVQTWMDKETWFSADRALSEGMADRKMPEPEKKEDADTKALSSVRRIEAALIRQGMPRAERRSLIADMKRGTPAAAASPEPVAGAEELANALRFAIDTLNRK